jgi:hypothetical protein
VRSLGDGMIEMKPPRKDVDIAGLIHRLLQVLRQANIGARRRIRSLKISGLVRMSDMNVKGR